MRRFELTDTMRENWDRYQDELEEHPELYAMIKVRFEHFMKVYVIDKKENEPKKKEAKETQLYFDIEAEAEEKAIKKTQNPTL